MAFAPISRFTGIDISGVNPNDPIHGFYTSSITSINIATLVAAAANPNYYPGSEWRDGAFVFANDLLQYQGQANGALVTFFTMVPQALGVGVGLNGTPFILPSGTSAGVEVAANEINGFTYYNTTANNVRRYVNGAWAAG